MICRVTSVTRSRPPHITLANLQAAGLLKPSVVRLDRLVTAEKTIFIRRISVLSPADLAAVRSAWNAHIHT